MFKVAEETESKAQPSEPSFDPIVDGTNPSTVFQLSYGPEV